MNEYLKLMEEAESLTDMTVNSFGKKKFDNKFLLSIATLSLEKFMVAYLLSKGKRPAGHTLSFLADEVSKYVPLPKEELDALKLLDDKIQLCSISYIAPYVPEDSEMSRIINTMQWLRDLVRNELVSA